MYDRVFRKVRKTRHQYLEFGPKPGEIQKKTLQKKHIRLQGAGSNSELHHFLCQTEFDPGFWHRLSFFLSASTAAATYIFTAPKWTTATITSNLVH